LRLASIAESFLARVESRLHESAVLADVDAFGRDGIGVPLTVTVPCDGLGDQAMLHQCFQMPVHAGEIQVRFIEDPRFSLRGFGDD